MQTNVTLGLVEPPLLDQLNGMAKNETLHTLDRLNSAINLLLMHGILTEITARNARKRLMKIIHKSVEI